VKRADPIPAIREEEATGREAAIFADLRVTLGVPFVNLIWRHLATMPEMLEWTWALVKPLYESEELVRASEVLRAAVTASDCITQPACVFDAVGVAASDRVVIGAMLRAYNAANASNLLCILVAQSVLTGALPDFPVPTAVSGPERPKTSLVLPKLPGLHELSPEIQSLVLELDKFGRFAPTEASASLYRHLTHWPGFLAVAHAALSAPHRDGRLQSEHAMMRDRARKLASNRILPMAAGPPPPVCADKEVVRTSLEIFTGDMIARMVVMGELMLALLPEQYDLSAIPRPNQSRLREGIK
jgi:hypothetical protein